MNHMRALRTLPPEDSSYSGRWKAIKMAFAKSVPKSARRSTVRVAKGERGIWQRRFWEHTIRDERDCAVHVDYVHINPVKHGLVSNVVDWPHSSFHHCVQKEVYAPDWGGREIRDLVCGERG